MLACSLRAPVEGLAVQMALTPRACFCCLRARNGAVRTLKMLLALQQRPRYDCAECTKPIKETLACGTGCPSASERKGLGKLATFASCGSATPLLYGSHSLTRLIYALLQL